MLKIFNAVLTCFFPKRCPCCDRLLKKCEPICDVCRDGLKRVQDSSTISSDENFFASTAPFYNEGSAQNGVYIFKFQSRTDGMEFFANEMAATVSVRYRKANLDAVCYVPTRFRNIMARGYNQSEVLAKKLAGELDISVVKAMKKIKSNRVQHTLDKAERIENVRGVFDSKDVVAGKNILLVDDIKTTGATLNECARVLKEKGAKNVYCITAILSR